MRDRDLGRGVGRGAGRLPGFGTSLLAMAGLVAALGAFGRGEPGADGERASTSASAARSSCRAVLKGRDFPVFALTWSPDGHRLAISGFGPVVRIWEPGTGRVRSIEGGTEQPRFAMGWSADGRRLVVGGLDVPVESWDAEAGRTGDSGEPVRPSSRSESLAMLAGATRGGPIRVWGPLDGRSGLLPSSEHPANSAAFAANGRSIVTGEVDQALRIWDADSGRLRHTLRGDARGFTSVAFSPDGSKVACGGGGPLNLWDASTGAHIATLGSGSGGSAAVAFSPDGSRLAGAKWDGSIRIWDLATGLEVSRQSGHSGQVLSLAWSPDGKTLASGGYDSSVRIWELAD